MLGDYPLACLGHFIEIDVWVLFGIARLGRKIGFFVLLLFLSQNISLTIENGNTHRLRPEIYRQNQIVIVFHIVINLRTKTDKSNLMTFVPKGLLKRFHKK